MNLNEIDFKKLHLQNKPIQFLMALILAVVIVVLGYFGLFQAQWEEYQSTVAKEAELKSDYEKKSAQAANLDNLKKELVDIEASIEVLIKQLPTSEEIPTLIQELHQAAAKNGLTMNSVTPEAKVIEKPIERLPFAISVTVITQTLLNLSEMLVLCLVLLLYQILILQKVNKTEKVVN